MPQWPKITVAGVGLLGGSIGMAAKQRRLAGHVNGLVRRTESIEECLEAGAVDEAFTDPARAVEGADLVLLCTPIAQMPSRVAKLLPALKQGAIVTDVGSVKGEVVAQLEPLIAEAGGQFIGSHPMAGAE